MDMMLPNRGAAARGGYAMPEGLDDADESATENTASDGLQMSELRQQFERYASAKSEEIDEFRLAHRYYSGIQYSPQEITVLNRRKQPVITFNRISRKVNGIVGTLRKLRTDPKAFPRTQNQEEAAELATQVIRYLCDASDFESIESDMVLQAAIIGYAGIELTLNQGRGPNPIPGMVALDSRTIFYDPRSVLWNFADARYMGTYKWVTFEEIDEIAPGFGDKVKGEADGTFSTQAETDRDNLWQDENGRVKLVDHWYIHDGKWKWCLHAGTVKIDSGESPFFDEDGKSICKFRLWSAFIDQDGDRYGFIRDMKGPQDAMNQHRSKAMHIMNTRQIAARRGSIADIAKMRLEAAKPDGVMIYDGERQDFEIIQPSQEFIQQTQYFQDAKDEIENFGPNQALLGTNMSAKSGRALAMMQQSGLAELGPFNKNYRMSKLDIYKCLWGAAKQHMQAEQWLRVTGNDKVAQFVQVNQLQLDEWGMPVVVNQLGEIDVDIVLDEGPDTETAMGDTFDTLMALANNQMPIPPEVLIELSTLPSQTKEKILTMLQPKPDPMKEANDQALVQQEVEKALKLQAETFKTTMDGMVQQQKLLMPQLQEGMGAPQQGGMGPQAMPSPAQPQAAPQPPVTIQFDAANMLGEIGMNMQGMAQQNNEFMGQVAASMAQSAETIANATNAIAGAAQAQSQASMAMSQAAEKMSAPKRLVRDPKTQRAIGVEMVM